MIRVHRTQRVPPAVKAALERRSGRGQETELEMARAYYALHKGRPKESFHFERYREFEVCSALDKIFKGKCAYCEAPYLAAGARNVEHFRPKGEVTEEPRHPGYWWLAARWSNLLASCESCNQRRKQVLFEIHMSLEHFEKLCSMSPATRSGKGNAFPLSNPAMRAMHERRSVSHEDALLINPNERDPRHHIEWVLDWDGGTPIWGASQILSAVRPIEKNGQPDPHGKASIALYGLNRSGLIRERMQHAFWLQRLSIPIVDVLGDMAGPKAPPKKLVERLKGYVSDLNATADDDRYYSGLARAYVSQFRVELVRMKFSLPDAYGAPLRTD
jgi:hypothetical protein